MQNVQVCEELQKSYTEEERLVAEQIVALRVHVDEEGDAQVMKRVWDLSIGPFWRVILWIWEAISKFAGQCSHLRGMVHFYMALPAARRRNYSTQG